MVIDKIGLAVIRHGCILLVRNTGTEKLLVPGGRRESGENDIATLIREIHEEIACDVLERTLEFLGTYTDIAANEPGSLVTIRLYRGDIVGSPVPSEEVEEVVWFSPSHDDMTRLSTIVQRQIFPNLIERHLLATS